MHPPAITPTVPDHAEGCIFGHKPKPSVPVTPQYTAGGTEGPPRRIWGGCWGCAALQPLTLLQCQRCASTLPRVPDSFSKKRGAGYTQPLQLFSPHSQEKGTFFPTGSWLPPPFTSRFSGTGAAPRDCLSCGKQDPKPVDLTPAALWGQTPASHIPLQRPGGTGCAPQSNVPRGAAQGSALSPQPPKPPPPPQPRNSSRLHHRGWTALFIKLNYSLGEGRETKHPSFPRL